MQPHPRLQPLDAATQLAKPRAPSLDRLLELSDAGLALGNLSGIILFCFFLFAWSWNDTPLFGLSLEQHEPERAVGILAGIWAILFCLPLFFFTPDSPGTSLSKTQAVKQGLRNLGLTARKIRNYKNIVTFLTHLLGKTGAQQPSLPIDTSDEITRETLLTQNGSVVHPRVRELTKA